MDERDAGPGVRFGRLPCEVPGVAVFAIAGSLGPAARPHLQRLFQECRQRPIPRLVLDLTGVESLGGGGARLLNEFAAERRARGLATVFQVGSTTLRSFLCRDANLPPPALVDTLEAAMSEVGAGAPGADPAPGSHGRRSGQTARRSDAELDRLLTAIGFGERRSPQAGPSSAAPQRDDGASAEPPPAPLTAGFTAAASAGPERASDTARPANAREDEGERELMDIAARWETQLRSCGLAERVHIMALQPDGIFHPITATGIDWERGLAYHGSLAQRVREQPGPAFLFDLCIDPLAPDEQSLVEALGCEIAARAESGEQVELLLFLAKQSAGDDYTLDELQTLQTLLRQAPHAPRPQPAEDAAHEPAAHEPPPLSPSPWSAPILEEPQPALPPVVVPSRDNALLVRGPASLLGAPAYRESERERLLRRKLTQLRDILGMSRGFDAAFGTARLLDVLVLSVVSIARSETVLFFSERDGEFVLTHHRGLDRGVLAEMAMRADSTLVQATLRTDRVLALDDEAPIAEEERVWARQHGFAYALAFRSGQRPLGLLLLGASHGGQPDLEMLAYLVEEAALAYERALLHETLQDHTLGVVRGLVTLIERNNNQEAGSTERVVRYTQALAHEVQFPEDARRDLVYGAVLRDIGMLRIDPAILRSSGQLTTEQWEIVRRHTLEGAQIMRQMRFGDIAIDVVLHHHEAYNGEGYPTGLRGRAIPLGARLVAVAESYVKMTMDRPYRKAIGQVEALESLAENWGLRYDPLVVDALARVVNRELSMGLDGDMDLARDLFGVAP